MSHIDIKKLLCEGFCSSVNVSQSGKLISVSVPFEIGGGDPVNFYVAPQKDNLFRIEDDGSFIPFLLASGVNILEGVRGEEFQRILEASDVIYNNDTGELASKTGSSSEIAHIIFKFINAVLKIDALKAPLRPEAIESMFKEDARNKISEVFAANANIVYDEAVNEELGDFLPDVVIHPHNGKPAAVYFLTSTNRAWEAIALRCKAIHNKQNCSVIALLDKVGTKLINQRAIASVSNNLDATPYFYDNQREAMMRIADEIGLQSNLMN